MNVSDFVFSHLVGLVLSLYAFITVSFMDNTNIFKKFKQLIHIPRVFYYVIKFPCVQLLYQISLFVI